MNYKNLQVGKVYNCEYIGDNQAYAKVNGKSTFRVVSLNPLKVRVLYDTFGSLFTDEILSNETTYSNPEFAFMQYSLSIPKTAKDYFVKSKVMSLDEAFEKGFVDVSFLERKFRDKSDEYIRRSPITSHRNENEKCFYSFSSGNIEGVCQENPYLQCVYFKYDSMDELKSSVRKFYPEAWFM